MAIKKRIFKTKPLAKVTFEIDKEVAEKIETASVVGDFNNWDPTSHVMMRKKGKSLSITVELEKGKEYQFRYLLDGRTWVNEPNSDKLVKTHFGDSENCVLIL